MESLPKSELFALLMVGLAGVALSIAIRRGWRKEAQLLLSRNSAMDNKKIQGVLDAGGHHAGDSDVLHVGAVLGGLGHLRLLL